MIQMLHQRKNYVLAIFTAILFMGGTAMGQTNTWIGPNNGFWNTGANWSGGTVPTATSDVVINTNVNIRVNVSTTINTLTTSGTATASLTADGGGRTITIDNTGSSIGLGTTLSLRGTTGAGTQSMRIIYTTAGSTMSIAGTLILTDVGDGSDYVATNSVTTVTGTLRKNDDAGTGNDPILTSTAANLIFAPTGIYNHDYDGDQIPVANWNAGSTVSITGMTNNIPANLDQTFSNVTFASVLGANVTLASPLIVNGNLTINNTGGGDLRVTNSATGRNVTVGGNFIHSSGNFVGVSSTGTSTISVGGNFIQSGGVFTLKEDAGTAALNITGDFTKTGGTFNQRTVSTTSTSTVTVGGNFSNSVGTYNMSSVAAIGVLNVGGDFSVTSAANTFTESSTGSGSVNFTGTGSHTYTANATTIPAANIINFNVAAGGTLQMATPTTAVISAGTFILGAGSTLGITSPDGIRATAIEAGGNLGNIQVTGLRTLPAAANYRYNGTALQQTGSGLPTNLAGNLIINNAAGVSLSAPRTINGGNIDLVLGTLTATSPNLITFGGTSSNIIRSGGEIVTSIFNYVDATSRYNITYNGASKTTGNEFLGGQIIPVRVNNVVVNLSPGQNLTMGAGVPVLGVSGSAMNGLLTLTSGLVNTGLTNGLILTDLATISGASASRYINGPLAKSGTAAFTFPIGTGGVYFPIAVSGNSTIFGSALSSSSIFLAQPFLDNPKKAVGSAFTAPLVSTSACIYWDLQRLGGTGDVHVWLSIDRANVCQNAPPELTGEWRVAHWEGGTPSWTDLGATPITLQNSVNFIGATTARTSFSPFTIGSVTDALPVELTNFSAAKNGNAVNLKWTTASEQNNAYFNVERSADGVSFSSDW